MLFFLNYLTFSFGFVLLSRIRKNVCFKTLEEKKEFNPSKMDHPHFLIQRSRTNQVRLEAPLSTINGIYELEQLETFKASISPLVKWSDCD